MTFKEMGIYWKMEEAALARTLWRTSFAIEYGTVVQQTT
jgi:hypothetical protein